MLMGRKLHLGGTSQGESISYLIFFESIRREEMKRKKEMKVKNRFNDC